MISLTASTRLGAIEQGLVHWCQTQTYHSTRDVFSCRREDTEEDHRLTVMVGGRTSALWIVTDERLEELTVYELQSSLDRLLKPLEPERREE